MYSVTDHMNQRFNIDQETLFGPLKVPCKVLNVFETGMDMEGFKFRYLVKMTESGRTMTKWEHELSPASEADVEQEQAS